MSFLDNIFSWLRKDESKPSSYTDEEREELRENISKVKELSKLDPDMDESKILSGLMEVIDHFSKTEKKEFLEISALVLAYYSSFILKDVVNKIFNHDEYEDTLERVETLKMLLGNAISDLEKYGRVVGKLDYKLYYDVSMLYAYILVCFRKFEDAHKYAKEYYEHINNDLAKDFLVMLKDNVDAEGKIAKAFMESTHLSEVDELTKSLALTLVDENGGNLFYYENRNLYVESNMSNINPVLNIRSKLNEKNLDMMNRIVNIVKEEFHKKAYVFSIGLESVLGDNKISQQTAMEYERVAKEMEKLNKKGKYHEVIDMGLEYAKHEDNEDPLFFHEIALAYSKLQIWNFADYYFTKSYKLDPSNTKVILSLSISKVQNKDYVNAKIYAEEYLRFKGQEIDLANKIIGRCNNIILNSEQ